MIIFESKYPNTYRQEEIKKILSFTQTGKFCQLIAAPGVGKATVLKLLAHNRELLKFHLKDKEKLARNVYVNLLESPSLNTEQISKYIFDAIETKHSSSETLQTKINSLAMQDFNVVLLFDHFDEYQNQLENSFFEMLKNLRGVAKYKFAVVFATRRNLSELVDPEVLKKYYDFFLDNAVVLKVKNDDATTLIISQTEEVLGGKLNPKDKDELLSLTGGHPKLTKVATELVLRGETKAETTALLSKQSVTATLDEIWQFLTAPEQEELRHLANKSKESNDQVIASLKNFDLIEENLSFTIPIFEQYVKTIAQIPAQKIVYNPNTKEIQIGQKVVSDLLSKQEYRMLKLMIESKGEVISRNQLIEAVWPDTQVSEGISDEAIDQMIFRLRKKIENEPSTPKHLTTIKGQGWRFSA